MVMLTTSSFAFRDVCTHAIIGRRTLPDDPSLQELRVLSVWSFFYCLPPPCNCYENINCGGTSCGGLGDNPDICMEDTLFHRSCKVGSCPPYGNYDHHFLCRSAGLLESRGTAKTCILIDPECEDFFNDNENLSDSKPIADPPEDNKPALLSVKPADSSAASDPPFDFGDTLKYEITVSQQAIKPGTDTVGVTGTVKVTCILKVSTYEGRCMNYPALTVGDTIADIYPDTSVSDTLGWKLIAQWFDSSRKCFRLEKKCRAGVNYVTFSVRDYAPEGDLEVFLSEDTTEVADGSPLKIPPDYETWKSTSDFDQDGFTVWEEYRGFILAGSIRRLDSLFSDVFLWNHTTDITSSYIDRAATVSGLDSFCTLLGPVAPPSETFQTERFLDFKRKKFVSSSYAENSLCLPGYTPPSNFPGDQGYIHFYSGEGGGGENGIAGECFRDADYPQPGGVGVDAVWVYTNYLNIAVNSYSGMNGNEATVYSQLLQRVVNHELGHAFGLSHPTSPAYNGTYSCVMSYVLNDSSDWTENRIPNTWPTSEPTVRLGWAQWIQLVGPEDSYESCVGTVRYRP